MSIENAQYQVADDVLAQSLGDTVVLFHPGTERLLSLNASGSRIWELLAEEPSVDQIIARLADEFDGPQPLIQQQVSAFLTQLEGEQLIRRGG